MRCYGQILINLRENSNLWMKTSPIMVGPSVPSPSLASLFGACCLNKEFRVFFSINQQGKKPVKCKVVTICIDCTARSFYLTPPVARLEGTMQRQVYKRAYQQHRTSPEREKLCLCQQEGQVHLSQARLFRPHFFPPLLVCC